MLFSIMKLSFCLIPFLISIAFFTLLERKVLGLICYRPSPNKVSLLGLLQPLSDGLKLSIKDLNVLSNYSYFFYYFFSLFMLFTSFLLFLSLPFSPLALSFNFSLLLIFIFIGLNSLNSIFCGWSGYSKFSLIGSIRSVSQLISYEVVLYLCFFFFLVCYSSFDLSSCIYFGFNFFFIPFIVCFYFWVPCTLAELNRTPYDFSEGESELVSGFNTEFGSSGFIFIFLSEYGNILFFCLMTGFIFFYLKFYLVLFFSFFYVWIRAVLPRFRFDKLMMLSWKFFIPFLTIFYLFFFLFLF